MPPQAFALAFAASIYPPAVAAVIALGRGVDVRPRVFAFVAASLLVTYAVGAAILYLLVEVGATGSHNLTPGGWVDVGLGVLLLLLALRLHLRRGSPIAALASRVGHGKDEPAPAPEPSPEARDGGESKIERYLHSRRLAFALGIVLYVLPSPIYVGAVKSIADANTSTGAELTALVVIVAIMLWMVELPMLMLLAFPSRATATLEAINRWFVRNGRALAILAAAGAGAYLIVKGVSQLD